MSTIKDIAKETGLGLATISKYLNGGNVRPENKILLEKAVKKLNFQVNEFARGLKTNKSKMIGIVIPELSNLFTTTIIAEIEDILRKNCYGVMVMDYRSDEKIEKEVVDFLLSRKIDGVVYMPISDRVENAKKLIDNQVPVVFIDRKVLGISADFVGVDNITAGKKATELLLDNNHKDIAIIAGPKDLKTTCDRLEGYKLAMKNFNLSVKEENIALSGYNIEDGYKSMKAILEKNSEVTAVFATNYEMTLGAIMAINEKGVKIPDDISFVGFDNIELSRVISPKITIVSQPIMEIARKSANLLLERLKNEGVSSQIILDCFIEQGKSIKKL